jgi:high-affinity K+ transport system ATPase subunit B
MSAVIFMPIINAPGAIALRGVKYRAIGASALLRENLLI